MSPVPLPHSTASDPLRSPESGCALTVFRMLVGPGLILAAGMALVMNKAPLGSLWDYVFLGVVLATIVAGLLAPRKAVSASPKPGELQPMSRFKYFIVVLGVAAAFFCFAHFVAPKLS